MSNPLIQWFESTQIRSGLPEFAIGDTVKVYYRIKEGEKERIQPFEGVVMRKHSGNKTTAGTFTVRKVTQGFGVERIFPFSSPLIDSLEVTRKGHVRRSKLYYLRALVGKKARIKEKEFAKPKA